uniref:Major facilitator superfamily (MFS) profile domain-containing protein n=1 Tax=Bionectria ochroleuca TaxID=29856 RepID=A0A8H7N0A2_BIOOC
MATFNAAITKELNLERITARTSELTTEEPLLKPSPWQWRLILFLIYLTSLLNGYDVSNVANIQASVYEAFGHIELLPWVALSYTMGAVAVTPMVRRVVETFDTKVLYTIFYVLFIVACTVSGSATSIYAVIVGRALMGLSYTGVYQMNLNLVSVFADAQEAARIAGMVGMFWAVGIIVGPFISAGFAENSVTTWRWAFYINLPFLGVLLCLTTFCLSPYTVRSTTSRPDSLLSMDFVGGALHCAISILLPCALIMSGISWSWNSSSTIITWVFLAIIFIVYIVQQKYALLTSSKNRVFPVDALTHRIAGLAALGAACSGITYAISLYYLPLFYAFVRGASPLEAAVHVIPFICFFILSIILASIALPLVGYYAPFFALAGILMLVGGVLMTTITSATSDRTIFGYQVLLAIGVGLIFSNAYSVANASLKRPGERIAAAALFNMASFSGICLALAVAGSLYHNVGMLLLQKELAQYGLDRVYISEALAGVASPAFQANARILESLQETVSIVVSSLFYIVVFAGAVCLLASLMMRWEKLDFKPKAEQEGDGEERDNVIQLTIPSSSPP